MDAVDLLLAGLLTPLLIAGALYIASGAVTSLGRFLTVLRADPTPLPSVTGETEGYFSATVAPTGDVSGPSAGYLATVTDRFGYWCLRTLADNRGTNLFGFVGRFLLRRRYGQSEVRSGGRRRANLLVPSPLALRADGQRTELELHRKGRPLQRLEADGVLVPLLVTGVSLLLLLVGLLVFPLLSAVFAAVARVGLPVVVAVPLAYLGLVAGLKGYHDTALVGGWDVVAAPESGVAPPAVVEAADTEDPPATALACLRRVETGDTLRLLGRVVADHDGTHRLVGGVVTTRGRAFLAVAVLVRTLRSLLATVVLGGAAVGILWLVVRSL